MSSGISDAMNPYVGPRPFEQVESKYFFGRDEETKILSGLVVAHQLSLFYAQSGAGKSSLLRAGLLPRLTRKTRVGRGEDAYLYQTMQVLPIVTVGRGVPPSTIAAIDNIFSFSAQLSLLPAVDPNDLAALHLEDAVEILLDDGIEAGAVWEPARERNGRVRPPLIKPDTTLLIFDQFEELFTTHPERWREREEFFRQVDATLTRFPMLHILFTMREDYLAELTPYANLLTDDLRHRFRMERLRKDGALDAVVQPALAGEPSRTYAPDVAEALVDNLRRIQRSQRSQLLARERQRVTGEGEGESADWGEYVEPVHLQIVCRDLWAGLPVERTVIRESDLQSFGDVDQALTNFYESTLAKVVAETEVSERALRRWFNEELITQARTKALVYRDEAQGETAGLPNAAMDILRDAWIIRVEVRSGDVWYELAHDRLVEPILAANQRWQQARVAEDPLLQIAQRWEERGRDEALLFNERQLEEALATPGLVDVDPIVLDFLEQSYALVERLEVENAQREAAAAKQRAEEAKARADRERRLREQIRWTLLSTAITVISIVLGVSAAVQRTQAYRLANQLTEEKVLRLTTMSRNESNQGEFSTAILLGIEAQRQAQELPANSQSSQSPIEQTLITAVGSAVLAQVESPAVIARSTFEIWSTIPNTAQQGDLSNKFTDRGRFLNIDK